MSDRIEKNVLLRAPLERVWRAISDSKQFGTWFGVEFDEPFAPGKPMVGRILPTKVDPEVAKQQAPYEGATFEILIETIEPMKLFSFRWHPFAMEKDFDYSKEPMTLVEFRLSAEGEGTRLLIVESGFDGLPLARRAQAFKANEGGWEHQSKLIEKYLAQ
jgi:uncharacterized protein YndB with AHSA1/START domain